MPVVLSAYERLGLTGLVPSDPTTNKLEESSSLAIQGVDAATATVNFSSLDFPSKAEAHIFGVEVFCRFDGLNANCVAPAFAGGILKVAIEMDNRFGVSEDVTLWIAADGPGPVRVLVLPTVNLAGGQAYLPACRRPAFSGGGAAVAALHPVVTITYDQPNSRTNCADPAIGARVTLLTQHNPRFRRWIEMVYEIATKEAKDAQGERNAVVGTLQPGEAGSLANRAARPAHPVSSPEESGGDHTRKEPEHGSVRRRGAHPFFPRAV